MNNELTQRILQYATDLEQQAKNLRTDTLVSIAEGLCNQTRAEDLEKIAKDLRRLAT